ncbi:metallophosphoesterase family protein [Corynebacterium sp. TAE3-ERU12]|uniref:purple acid phosphatase family protein n=1 Tax=Corynebacterium sp. TAE3-ERU12 TaxID=2849491 RepID=UPI001C43CF34|nr:metallophosphoesterase family protein [Corynebacterium sp. TAE3-ERU12]MBV7295479.1 metallophosphoesterase family protein [Corynebacterium sp. TAE3-ERU12]
MDRRASVLAAALTAATALTAAAGPAAALNSATGEATQKILGELDDVLYGDNGPYGEYENATVNNQVDPHSPVERVIVAPSADGAHGVTITFRSPSENTSVEYRTGNGQLISVPAITKDEYDGRFFQFVELTGLAGGTEYTYRVRLGDQHSQWYRFTTAANSHEPFDVLYVGDAQNGLTTHWPITAHTALNDNPEAKLLLQGGDMINHSGQDKQWSDWYNGIGPEAPNTPMLTALGNHEIWLKDDGPDPTARAYRNHFTHPLNGPAQFPDSSFYVDYQGVRIVVLTGNYLGYSAQAAFLERALATNPHQWSLVMLHQPIINSTDKRVDPAQLAAFAPVIEAHDVDLVLTGHDHSYARGHLTSSNKGDLVSGPVYLTATAGSKFYPTSEDNLSWKLFGAQREVWAQGLSTYQRLHFSGCALEVTATVTVTDDADIVSSNGVTDGVLDQFTIDKCGGDKIVR